MLIRLLGPVDVLAALALHGGEVVSAGRLAEVVWGEDARRP